MGSTWLELNLGQSGSVIKGTMPASNGRIVPRYSSGCPLIPVAGCCGVSAPPMPGWSGSSPTAFMGWPARGGEQRQGDGGMQEGPHADEHGKRLMLTALDPTALHGK